MWLREVGRRGWVALTHNKDIYYTPVETEAVMRVGLPLLIIIGQDPHAQLAQNFVQTLSKIERFVDEHEPPYIAKVKKRSREALQAGIPGRVEMWLSEDDWREER